MLLGLLRLSHLGNICFCKTIGRKEMFLLLRLLPVVFCWLAGGVAVPNRLQLVSLSRKYHVCFFSNAVNTVIYIILSYAKSLLCQTDMSKFLQFAIGNLGSKLPSKTCPSHPWTSPVQPWKKPLMNALYRQITASDSPSDGPSKNQQHPATTRHAAVGMWPNAVEVSGVV